MNEKQKGAIAAFAATHSFEIVRNYEDDGKSGVGVSNRPRLLQLIADVVNKPDFSAILSRWADLVRASRRKAAARDRAQYIPHGTTYHLLPPCPDSR